MDSYSWCPSRIVNLAFSIARVLRAVPAVGNGVAIWSIAGVCCRGCYELGSVTQPVNPSRTLVTSSGIRGPVPRTEEAKSPAVHLDKFQAILARHVVASCRRWQKAQ
jgi:hypothetical protein